jgi:rhodanese-related sulfurtransferase
MSDDNNSFAGDVAVGEALDALAREPQATLIDVRTEPEWQFVGGADLSDLGKEVVYLSWQVYPAMQIQPDYAERLGAELRRRGLSQDAPLYFLCRSGARSRAAAIEMTKAGWTRSYNVVDGFEGALDAERKRGRTGGWKAKGLPWRQS